ncbi:protein FAM49B isoform X2 [Phasianus colchicus]|uniref:protein FAM49B isoform X2 n=1 Tax=Phasianus colchicus TaxID=9054 RepID=UPI00129DFD2B|nr:protein FAM49B isoform X2 [Phasianus colchicus]
MAVPSTGCLPAAPLRSATRSRPARPPASVSLPPPLPETLGVKAGACAVCWQPGARAHSPAGCPPPSALLPAGTSGSPHARPHGRSPVVLCGSPPPPPPPSPQCGRLRRCRHPPLPCAGSGPARPREAAAPAPSASPGGSILKTSCCISNLGKRSSLLRLQEDTTNWYLNMGNLLKVLTCTDLEQGPNFFLDFENAQPTESEKEIYNQVNVVLKDAEGILEDLQSYRGAGHEIREAIQHPNDEKLQEKAWGAVVPLVGKLKKFYEFSQRLEAGLRGLLGALTSTPYSPTQHLEREQALAKQFAEILHFTLRFDELKMTNPAIQNDFSYYRRTLSRMRINNVPAEGENEVNNELANRMSLFYAEATPMLKTLSDATTKFVSENKNLPIENTTDCLSTMASVCRVMLETPEYRSRFTNEETVSFCLRVMVGVIILYDHVHPVGAFAKTSKIDMKGCIKVLKDQPPNSVEGLLNALRYTTKHLNDETTSKQIKSMLQ